MTRTPRDNRSIVSAIALAGLLCVLGQPFLAANAQESCPECSKEQFIESLYEGPVHLDSYWVTSESSSTGSEDLATITEVEVGPGDGASTLAIVLVNRGPSDISGVKGELSLPDGFKATGKAAGDPADAAFNQIAKVGTPFVLFFDVDVLDASVGEYSTNLRVEYSRFFETGVPRVKDITVPFRITGEPILTVGRGTPGGEGSSESEIVAGRIEQYSFDISNEGTAPITNVVVTMVSASESLEILGDSKWTIQRIEENSKVTLPTQIFAATPLIGDPASFDVTVEYTSNGISSTEKFTLGTYVAGEISIRAYEIEVTDIGGTPNVVGNLLNEGNTLALFTTIELVDGGNLVATLPPLQYLGDLEENSPLPFSIPIDVGNAGAGTYPISLKVTYKDNLRELYTIDINSEVTYAPLVPIDESAAGPSTGILLPVGIGAVIAVAIAAAVLIRRRRRAALKRSISARKHEDIEFLLDGQQRVETRTEDRK